MRAMPNNFVSANRLGQYPPPRSTSTHAPLAHAEVMSITQGRIQAYGLRVVSAPQALLIKGGTRMFGVFDIEHSQARTLVLAVRNSYDKSLSLGVAWGQRFVHQDVLCFSGREKKYMRRPAGFAEAVDGLLSRVSTESVAMDTDIVQFDHTPQTLDEGYGVLGRLLGRGLLTPTQANIAFSEWREDSEHTLLSLYTAVGSGLRHGAVDMTHHAAIHTFLKEHADK